MSVPYHPPGGRYWRDHHFLLSEPELRFLHEHDRKAAALFDTRKLADVQKFAELRKVDERELLRWIESRPAADHDVAKFKQLVRHMHRLTRPFSAFLPQSCRPQPEQRGKFTGVPRLFKKFTDEQLRTIRQQQARQPSSPRSTSTVSSAALQALLRSERRDSASAGADSRPRRR